MYLALVSSPDSRNFICGNICLKHAGATVYREAGYTGGLGGTRKNKNIFRDCTSIRLSIFKTLKTSGQCFNNNVILEQSLMDTDSNRHNAISRLDLFKQFPLSAAPHFNFNFCL